MKHYFTVLTFCLIVISCQNQNGGIELTYLGTAGWVIKDEATKVLVGPYLSRIKLVGMSTSSMISKTAQNRDWGSDD